jgi:hypothetical protein
VAPPLLSNSAVTAPGSASVTTAVVVAVEDSVIGCAVGADPSSPTQPGFVAFTSTVLSGIEPNTTQPFVSVDWLRFVELPLTVTVAPDTSAFAWFATLTSSVVLAGTATSLVCSSVFFAFEPPPASVQLTTVVLLMNSAEPLELHVSTSSVASPVTYSANDSIVYFVPPSSTTLLSCPTCVSFVSSRPRRRSSSCAASSVAWLCVRWLADARVASSNPLNVATTISPTIIALITTSISDRPDSAEPSSARRAARRDPPSHQLRTACAARRRAAPVERSRAL